MTFKKQRDTPMQEAVLDRLRDLIRQYPAGSKLPTVRQLIVDYGVGQHVIQTALEKLRSEGLVTSHVGKGTFVGNANLVKRRTRNVLTLLYEHPYLRGDVIARILHQRLSIDGHESMVLAYSNAANVMDILKSGTRYDAAILQPRSSAMSISLLALLKQRAEHVLIEGYAGEHLDVDSVSNDPARTVELLVDHLFGLGHKRVAWVTDSFIADQSGWVKTSRLGSAVRSASRKPMSRNNSQRSNSTSRPGFCLYLRVLPRPNRTTLAACG